MHQGRHQNPRNCRGRERERERERERGSERERESAPPHLYHPRKVTDGETRDDGDASPPQSWVSTERESESESYSGRERKKENLSGTFTRKGSLGRLTPGDRLCITAYCPTTEGLDTLRLGAVGFHVTGSALPHIADPGMFRAFECRQRASLQVRSSWPSLP